jgi:predicted nucleic-acid-binding protein
MISLDTNILLRYILDDSEHLSPAASALIEENQCYVPLLAFAEAGYVLTSFFKASKSEVLTFANHLLHTANIAFEHELRIPIALKAYESGVDWFDAMLWCAAPPTQPLATFDKKFKNAAARQKLTQPLVQSHLPT